jgi:hypothetical protein
LHGSVYHTGNAAPLGRYRYLAKREGNRKTTEYILRIIGNRSMISHWTKSLTIKRELIACAHRWLRIQHLAEDIALDRSLRDRWHVPSEGHTCNIHV